MAKSVGKKSGNLVVWVIILLLILGLGGFGITNFGGSTRVIGAVGDQDIAINDYARALQNELSAREAQLGQPIPMAQAEAMGLTTVVRSRLIADAALGHETARLGVSVGDQVVGQSLLDTPDFRGADGTFDRDIYRFLLDREGLNERDYENRLRREIAQGLVQSALLSGLGTPPEMKAAWFSFIAETRDYTLITLDATQLDPPVATPDDAALDQFYADNPDRFTTPETRDITYAWVTPDMILDTITVDEDTLRAQYQDRLDDYVVPERRLVERLVFPDAQQAQAAADRIAAGDTTFEDEATARGLTLDDIDLGDVAQPELDSAGAPVFALSEPGVTGPHDSDLGPALYRMNAILEGRETTFEQARDELREELAMDAARRQIGDMVVALEDELAAGATLEELSADGPMQLGTIHYFPGHDDAIAAYDSFRAAAEAAAQGDFPEMTPLEDGGYFALRLDGVTAPQLRDLADAREDAITGWQDQETARRLTALGEQLQARIKAGDAPDDLGYPLERVSGLTRGGIEPESLSDAIFGAALNDVVVQGDGARVLVAQITAIAAPDSADPQNAQLERTIDTQLSQSIAQDLFLMYSQALVNRAGLELNQAALNSVHAQFP